MPTSLDDILAARDAAVAEVTSQMVAANRLKNAGAQGMEQTINDLAAKRAEIAAQAYAAALDDPTMTKALAAIRDATQQMNQVAKIMVTAASFLANVNDFLAAADKVIPALKGLA